MAENLKTDMEYNEEHQTTSQDPLDIDSFLPSNINESDDQSLAIDPLTLDSDLIDENDEMANIKMEEMEFEDPIISAPDQIDDEYDDNVESDEDTNENRSTVTERLSDRKESRSDSVEHFQCTYCEYVSRHRPSLIRHMRIHTDGGLFKCDVCSKGFSAPRKFVDKLKFFQ